jgi:hypothetical protein
MGAFICQVSKMDWLVSRKIGVYGNREGTDRDGVVKYFVKSKNGVQIVQSIIEDLIGMRKGDIVFFHVLEEQEESTLHGVYRVREEPFYNESVGIWKSSASLVYPYRFCFEPHPDYADLCKCDVHVPVSEFYRSVEQRKVISVLTLEREVRGAAHAVKKITQSDGDEITRLLYRKQDMSPSNELVDFRPMQMAMSPLRNYIEEIGSIEFSIKALLAYELGRKNPNVTKYFPACREPKYDILIEAFIGQTMRRPIDLMCISVNGNKIITTIEAKTDQSDIYDLIQTFEYQDIFKLRNIDKGAINYNFSICLLARRFSSRLIEYVAVRNVVLPWEEVILLRYDPSLDGKDAKFFLQQTAFKVSSFFVSYPIITSIEIDKILNDANSYKTLRRKMLDNIKFKLISSENDLLIIRKFSENNICLGDILIYMIRGGCSIKQFSAFMKLVKQHADNNYDGDFMSVEPVIIAESFENSINLFIKSYNEFETRNQRAPIIAYIKE